MVESSITKMPPRPATEAGEGEPERLGKSATNSLREPRDRKDDQKAQHQTSARLQSKSDTAFTTGHSPLSILCFPPVSCRHYSRSFTIFLALHLGPKNIFSPFQAAAQSNRTSHRPLL